MLYSNEYLSKVQSLQTFKDFSNSLKHNICFWHDICFHKLKSWTNTFQNDFQISYWKKKSLEDMINLTIFICTTLNRCQHWLKSQTKTWLLHVLNIIHYQNKSIDHLLAKLRNSRKVLHHTKLQLNPNQLFPSCNVKNFQAMIWNKVIGFFIVLLHKMWRGIYYCNLPLYKYFNFLTFRYYGECHKHLTRHVSRSPHSIFAPSQELLVFPSLVWLVFFFIFVNCSFEWWSLAWHPFHNSKYMQKLFIG